MSPSELTSALRRSPLRLGVEDHLQLSIGESLGLLGLKFEREVRLSPKDRIDFFVEGRIGIEAKVRCNKRAIFRQLTRYAEHDIVSSLILITSTPIGLPAELNGKLLYYVSVGQALL